MVFSAAEFFVDIDGLKMNLMNHLVAFWAFACSHFTSPFELTGA